MNAFQVQGRHLGRWVGTNVGRGFLLSDSRRFLCGRGGGGRTVSLWSELRESFRKTWSSRFRLLLGARWTTPAPPGRAPVNWLGSRSWGCCCCCWSVLTKALCCWWWGVAGSRLAEGVGVRVGGHGVGRFRLELSWRCEDPEPSCWFWGWRGWTCWKSSSAYLEIKSL